MHFSSDDPVTPPNYAVKMLFGAMDGLAMTLLSEVMTFGSFGDLWRIWPSLLAVFVTVGMWLLLEMKVVAVSRAVTAYGYFGAMALLITVPFWEAGARFALFRPSLGGLIVLSGTVLVSLVSFAATYLTLYRTWSNITHCRATGYLDNSARWILRTDKYGSLYPAGAPAERWATVTGPWLRVFGAVVGLMAGRSLSPGDQSLVSATVFLLGASLLATAPAGYWAVAQAIRALERQMQVRIPWHPS